MPGGVKEAEGREPSRSDIAEAVALRLQAQGQAHGEDTAAREEAKRQSDQKAKIRKSVNELTASISYEKGSACLRLIHTLMDNIVRHPSEAKYRSFKTTQPKIARDVLSLDAGKSLLVDVGFRTRTVDFQQEWFVPLEWTEHSLGMKRIGWSREVVETKMNEFEENAERVRFSKEKEKSFESNRKSRALEEAREDRERVAIRAERERAARKAAEVKMAEEKEAATRDEDVGYERNGQRSSGAHLDPE